MIEITHEFDAPGPQPNGMQATADGIWFLDQKTNQAALVSFTGETLKTLDTASDRGSGITAAGSELWLASTYDSKILRMDPETGVTLERFDTPGAVATGAHGLEIRDGCLWMAVPPSATIYQVDLKNGFNVAHAIPAPGDRPHGIAWEAGDLWCVETDHRAIYRLNTADGSILEEIDIPTDYPEPHGMTMWDGTFWYCDAGSRSVCRVTRQ